jgi:uncharacterized membrane protein
VIYACQVFLIKSEAIYQFGKKMIQLSPEERKKVYEEEKSCIDAEQKKQRDSSTPNLSPNVAGLLCYVAGWISGIVFLVIEQKNRFVRFHAAQSIIVLGVLNIIHALLHPIPVAGRFFSIIIAIFAFFFMDCDDCQSLSRRTF